MSVLFSLRSFPRKCAKKSMFLCSYFPLPHCATPSLCIRTAVAAKRADAERAREAKRRVAAQQRGMRPCTVGSVFLCRLVLKRIILSTINFIFVLFLPCCQRHVLFTSFLQSHILSLLSPSATCLQLFYLHFFALASSLGTRRRRRILV
jgi:hypothetical protein